MGDQYDSIRQRTLAAITARGGVVTFRDSVGQVYDPLTDTWSGGTSSVVTGRGVQVLTNVLRVQALGLAIQKTVTLAVAADGLSIIPAPGMTMTWSTVDYAIKDVESVAPEGVEPIGKAIMYTIIGLT